ncbi:MAG: TIGR03435 family protein [Candidatus Sulfopaludibacter sp.]|nr:TIGR03435 family protein [Candidatus Sulfopaludibacter sp.]
MRSLVFLTLAIAAARAQSGPAFEVVSVKPSAMQDGNTGMGLATYPGGRIRANMCKLDYLITEAFDIQFFQVAGGPRWIHEDRFDIDAKPPANSAASKANPRSFKLPPNPEQRLMLQALLADRFQLRSHRETREGPVYLLTRTNKELKLQPTQDSDEYPWVGSVAGAAIARDGLRATNATMALLTARLSSYLERPVFDRTGLPGAFDFRYEFSSDDPATDVISVIMASLQGLGLKLEAGKGPVETLVIDRVAHPAAN